MAIFAPNIKMLVDKYLLTFLQGQAARNEGMLIKKVVLYQHFCERVNAHICLHKERN